MLSKEDYDYLIQYEKTFETTYKHNYAHILPRTINEKLDQILNDGVTRNFGCSACVMAMYRKLYQLLQTEKTYKVHKEPEPTDKELVKQPINKKRATNKNKTKEE